MIIRKHIVFTGYVQGVGFRWRARHAANNYDCTGWVRNEWDGSVTMEVQGTEEQINLVLKAIHAGRYIEIQNMETAIVPVDEKERGFRTE